jgi:uncharacterized integral membrane protein
VSNDVPRWEPTDEPPAEIAADEPAADEVGVDRVGIGPSTAQPARSAGPAPEGFLASIRWGLIAFIVLAVVVIVLAAQNTQVVEVRALNFEVEAPLVVIILITVLVTVILDELVGVIIRRRRKRRRAEREELRRLRERDAD